MGGNCFALHTPQEVSITNVIVAGRFKFHCHTLIKICAIYLTIVYLMINSLILYLGHLNNTVHLGFLLNSATPSLPVPQILHLKNPWVPT